MEEIATAPYPLVPRATDLVASVIEPMKSLDVFDSQGANRKVFWENSSL
jgi:hypothetical protein